MPLSTVNCISGCKLGLYVNRLLLQSPMMHLLQIILLVHPLSRRLSLLTGLLWQTHKARILNSPELSLVTTLPRRGNPVVPCHRKPWLKKQIPSLWAWNLFKLPNCKGLHHCKEVLFEKACAAAKFNPYGDDAILRIQLWSHVIMIASDARI